MSEIQCQDSVKSLAVRIFSIMEDIKKIESIYCIKITWSITYFFMATACHMITISLFIKKFHSKVSTTYISL